MTTGYLTTMSNSHIAALESVFAEATNPIEWLVIAHNSAQMLRSLRSILAGESAAVLELSQDKWDFEDDLPETIEWALQQGHLTNLLLVGNSQPSGSESRASLVPFKATQAAENGYAKLRVVIQRANALNRTTQERFAGNFQRMSQIPVVRDQRSSGELAVHGLFYRAENGLFLVYDAKADTFRTLVAQA